MTENKMLEVLDKCYDVAILGVPRLNVDSVVEISNEYLLKYYSKDEAIDKFISNQLKKCTASGFLTNLGGIITLPVAIPANVSSVLWFQLRMIACIAHMNGYDVKSDEVKTLSYLCLLGSSASDILKSVGIKVGENITKKILDKIPGKILIEINKKVGFRLISKAGTKSAIVITKAIPVVGGIVGGGIDYYATKKIAEYAKKNFGKSL